MTSIILLASALILLATCFHAPFLLGLFFHPEDGCDMFLRNIGLLSTDCTELYPEDTAVRTSHLTREKVIVNNKQV
jgi:hypothetical protein